MEIKSRLESKYGAQRGHLTFGYQVILIRTRASDEPSDDCFLRFVLPADNNPKVVFLKKWVTEWVSRHMIVTCYSFSQ